MTAPRREPGRSKLVAVLALGDAAEETATHELLRDRGPTLREERGAVEFVVTAAPCQPPGQHAESDFPSTRGRLR